MPSHSVRVSLRSCLVFRSFHKTKACFHPNLFLGTRSTFVLSKSDQWVCRSRLNRLLIARSFLFAGCSIGRPAAIFPPFNRTSTRMASLKAQCIHHYCKAWVLSFWERWKNSSLWLCLPSWKLSKRAGFDCSDNERLRRNNRLSNWDRSESLGQSRIWFHQGQASEEFYSSSLGLMSGSEPNAFIHFKLYSTLMIL